MQLETPYPYQLIGADYLAAAWDAAWDAQSNIIRRYFPECPTIQPSRLRKAA